LNIQTQRADRHFDVPIVKIPGWEQYRWLLHGISTRAGGVSSVYGKSTLNLGWTKEDNPASVAENRRRFLSVVTHNDQDSVLVGVRQIHSATVRVIQETDGPFDGRLQSSEGKAVLEGDGLITDVPGVLLGVGTADCVPVLIVDVEKKVVGAFHAGWRGTVARIAEQGVAKMAAEFGSRVEDMVAAVGPSIGPCCYTVGEEVQRAFAEKFDYADELFSSNAQDMRLDLWKANRSQLMDAGIDPKRITVIGECTACAREENGELRYFSHRGEKGVAGRMLNVVGLSSQFEMKSCG
jgi:polyphenol oxidase